jgi:hypothetical protein
MFSCELDIYGRALVGKRARKKVKGIKSKNVSVIIIAAMTEKEVIHYKV